MQVDNTPIPGLLIVRLDVHGDNRGWFKENWQREKMVAAGLPDFHPVQQNISFNAEKGVTRGLHAEPWDKLVSVAHGRVHGGWCDLREGSETYGETFALELDESVAVFVPRGVANGFQALEPNTSYAYLVNAHWSPDAEYAAASLDLIDWPLEPTEVSEKDAAKPEPTPMAPRKILVTGANGQLGRALRTILTGAHVEFCTREEFDITSSERDWSQYSIIINTAAYNDVNGAESDRAGAWAVNAAAPARLARIAAEHNLTLVHVSSDYIFDGEHCTAEVGGVPAHTEEELPSPLSAYGASKAAGDTAAQTAPKHYVIRTAWVFGEGSNFMATMQDLALRGMEPSVVHDQRGRPTHAADLAGAIKHLLDTQAPYGVYNLTSGGDAVGRDEIAMAVFIAMGKDPSAVTPVSTEQYGQDAAARPAESTLDLSKLEATGFKPRNWRAALALYLA